MMVIIDVNVSAKNIRFAISDVYAPFRFSKVATDDSSAIISAFRAVRFLCVAQFLEKWQTSLIG